MGTTVPRVLPAGRMKLTYFNLKGRAAPAGGGGRGPGSEYRHSSLSRPPTRTRRQDGDRGRPGGHGHRQSGRPDGARGGHDEGEGGGEEGRNEEKFLQRDSARVADQSGATSHQA